MMDPPCLVAGRECSLEVHFCREVVVKNMEVTRDGESVNARRRQTKKGKKIRLSIPANEGCRVSVGVARPACPEAMTPSVDVLALPREAAEEVCQLFERMVAGVQRCGGEGPAPELYGDQQDVRVRTRRSATLREFGRCATS
ncbi:unnamed protein product [Ostreobium quekettii]|uniref:Uncharacterized protein n=1 Tax=Ostreobium quekettii TaxID=121088 RepID=A0A8S1J717_9CHLO|nr:unnamed protein product [Ostreobium quekettii]